MNKFNTQHQTDNNNTLNKANLTNRSKSDKAPPDHSTVMCTAYSSAKIRCP